MHPRIDPIRAVDIRDWGLVDEDTIPVEGFDDLQDLFEGVDEDGVAQ
jgi:hypothetical protein